MKTSAFLMRNPAPSLPNLLVYGLVSLFFVLGIPRNLKADSLKVQATLQNNRITLGQATTLSVSISGGQADPQIPEIDGLQLTPVGQSSQYQFVNGRMSASVTRTYQVLPLKAGTFTIPPIEVRTSQGVVRSQEITLQVLKTASSAPSASGKGASSLSQLGNGTPSATPSKDELAFLRIILPKKELYEGEMLPIEIKGYFISGLQAQISSLPSINEDHFLINQIEGPPVQKNEIINGRQYTVVTWSTALTALQPGEYSLKAGLDVVVAVKDRRSRRRMPGFDSFFDDSFFDDVFSRTIRKEIALESDGLPLQVQAVPEEGKPVDFSGAVGQFEITSSLEPTAGKVGDPLTLTVQVEGKGSLERIQNLALANADEWKTYSPTSSYEPLDASGFEGKKTFTQAIIPQKPGDLAIPELSLAYFDPEQKKFLRKFTQPRTVLVAAAPAAPPASSFLPNPASTPTTVSASTPSNSLKPFRVNRVEAGTFIATLTPLVQQPWFLTIQAVPFGLLGFTLLLSGYRKRYEQRPELREKALAAKAVTSQLKAMEQAMIQADSEAFFHAARRAIQEALALRLKVNPESITVRELKDMPETLREPMRQIFETADAITYSGQVFDHAGLEQWKQSVRQILKELESQR